MEVKFMNFLRCINNRPLIYLFGTILLVIVLYTISKKDTSSDSASDSILSVLKDRYSTLTSSSDKCEWIFDHYSPSSWETYWTDNIDTLQEKVCPTLLKKGELNKSNVTLKFIKESQKTIAKQSSPSKTYDKLLSKMYYRYDCAGSSKSDQIVVSQYIEPLIGLLRDPFTICPYHHLPWKIGIENESSVQSKNFILLGPSASYQNFEKPLASIVPWLSPPGAKTILFDLGASYFNGMPSAQARGPVLGSRWFYEYFLSLSINLDRIIAFELVSIPPLSYWEQIPDDIIGKLTFINTGVTKKGKFNPWNILKTIAKPDDYVMVKLDIDNRAIEMSLINEILNDTSISSLIDEMFFEMHIQVKEMKPYWGAIEGDLKDSYILFRQLRELGIRMHSWP